MPLPIQSGDLADRLRRFFRLSGRIPSALDETVVPVALIQDLGEPPWRGPAAASDFSISLTTVAVAATRAYATIKQPAGGGGRTVIERLTFWNTAAATRVIAVNYSEGGWVDGQVAVANLINVENARPNLAGGAGVLPERLGPTAHTGNFATSAGAEIFAISCAAGLSVSVPVRWTLPPGWQIIVMLTTVAEDLTVSLAGTVYPQA